jgi:predicted PurR-regulated permease PerM
VTAWILAFEPTSIFFSGILHKEPFMLLAEGMVSYGGARLWKRGQLTALIPMVVGCLLATATRPYAGWFLSAAAAAVALHAGLKRRSSPARSFVLIAIVIGLAAAFFPAVWNASSKQSLQQLQSSQDFNAHGVQANLSLERVDYSTRNKIVTNLPQRILDITTKPYPWQLGNTSQRLGLLGTTFLFVGLIFLLGAMLTNGKEIMRRAGPLVYPALFLLVAYSLSAGNAGTAFRYRTHLVAFLVAVLVVLRTARQERRAAVRERTRVARIQPIIARGQTT